MSTTTVQDVIDAGRLTSLTSSVLAEWAGKGSPKQREYLHEVFRAEHESGLE
ncbi:hypothetical protein [Arthrobacter sp. H35-D1]|uniref:hypothetical protein n=1 Tax=Arthrobacter sp. H35-D1 TaxID=3046202 RepID=UPI0024B94479|nr:hypothetical protein [Arthrobacter sp. H35-D1]MDJ0313892.1 hypothetical protein [Arthrobacter sp. H35-D1]